MTERQQPDDQKRQPAPEKARANVLASFIQDASQEFKTPLTGINPRNTGKSLSHEPSQ